ncbi:MAG: hypothetical protein V8T87_17560 [Victivallales bacterium]
MENGKTVSVVQVMFSSAAVSALADRKNAAELNSPVLLSFCRAEGNRIAFLPLCKNIIFFSFAALAFGAAGDIIFILLWKTFSIRFNPEKR